MFRTGLKWIILAPVLFVLFLLFIALGGLVVQLLWNWLLPAIFGWSEISYWQALGLLALCRILFGGWSGGGGRGSRIRRRMDERWEFLTPEERELFRERFRQRMRERCGFGPHPGEGKAE